MLIQEPVHAAIWHCLNHYAYKDATFLSERLFFEVGSDESLHLLATCYYRAGKTNQAYNLLSTQGARTPQNRFLLAKCCAKLNKLSEAESLFFDDIGSKETSSIDDVVSKFGDTACFALQILSKIYTETERSQEAIDSDRKALSLNPFLWNSFESLCQRGEAPDPAKIFTVSNVDNFSQCHGTNPILHYANSLVTQGVPNVPMGPTQQANNHLHVKSGSVTSTPINVQQSNITAPKTMPLSGPGFEVTPQQQIGLPIPRLMLSMITPVQSQGESTPGNFESCFTGSPVTDNSRMLSGIGALNVTSDNEGTTHISQAPVIGRRKRMPTQLGELTPAYLTSTNNRPTMVRNLARLLVVDNSSDRVESNGSFGILPHGTVSWSNRGVKLNQDPSNGGRMKLDFSSLAVLSPFGTPGLDSLVASTPTAVLSTPLTSGQQALSNTTNNDLKTSKRGLTESNSMKLNVFTPSSQNNTNNIQNVTPQVTGVGVGTVTGALNATGPNLVNSSSIQNVRRSSRLFVSSQQSKSKENSKGVQPAPIKNPRLLRSPSRKSSKSSTTSNRFVTTSSVDLAAEKNEKNKEKFKKDKDLMNTSTATLTPMAFISQNAGQFQFVSDETAQILNAQALVIQRHCVEGLMQLMRQCGYAYLELSRYNCRKAISLYDDIPAKHKNTGWVLGQLGRAHFELGQYKDAKRYFEELRDHDPHRVEFMEYYSTTLWHLQEEVQLSALAQELTRLEKDSPQAWCAAGNCFSHQKEHENSIKFFTRAIQIDDQFAYAYTLLGHEFVMIEELEKALNAFRGAVRVDPRHYNAWYGIGLTYYKQERFQLAEFYYRKALAINPQSPILMCHVAVVQHALQKTDKALETLSHAIAAAPNNPLCKYERASILFASEKYHEALKELNELKMLAPKESPVYFLIGKVHNKLNNTHLALMHFSWAMDLDPKVANSQIKDALDPTLNRIAQEDSGPLGSEEEYLVVEDLEGTVDQTGGDVIMVPDDSPSFIFNQDLGSSSQGNRSPNASYRASTPPAPAQQGQGPFASGGSDESL